jgi:hypothetical protein
MAAVRRNAACTLEFRSRLQARPAQIWDWIVSADGIRRELRPLLDMSVPPGVASLADVTVAPGARLFRSRMHLFGLIPIGHSDLTLLELEPGKGFVEQSPMTGMRLWRHERRILEVPGDCDGDGGACELVDRLGFRPYGPARLVRFFIRRLFLHRHAVLRAQFNFR